MLSQVVAPSTAASTAQIFFLLIKTLAVISSVPFSTLRIRPHQNRSAHFGAHEKTILPHAILSQAQFVRVYALQQHMAVTCCQGSSSPGPASPGPGTDGGSLGNCAAQDTGPLSVLLPRLLLSARWPLFPGAPPRMPRLVCMPVDSDLTGLPSKLNGRGNSINKMHPVVTV